MYGTNIETTWQFWESRFRRSEADLLSDYVDPVDERHMELRPDDELSIAGKQHKRANSSTSFTGDMLAAVFEIDGDTASPTHRRQNTRDFMVQNDAAFWEACQSDPGLNPSGKRVRRPPGF